MSKNNNIDGAMAVCAKFAHTPDESNPKDKDRMIGLVLMLLKK
jgi:hypothetical protein